MSVTTRQNRLLITEDWKKIYQSFRNADFQSYDFENLRRTMIDYIRQNYPEDFNDYIESSEYLALIDLIAFLGQSIAFRVDLNARENFLELAERRESILRLARMIGYNAKRNISASGLLKFTTVQTTENVIDSNGRNIANQVITWNDPSNSNWYDQFIKAMNAAMPKTQQFGSPADSATIYGIPTQQYRLESSISGIPVFGFSKSVSGRNMGFEVTSTTFSGQNYIYEEAPKVNNKLACVYRDDGRGAGSASTGFFLHFVQGTLNTGTFSITQPSSNESIDIDAQNINNSDIWLYKLDQSGLESESWTPVSNFEANNIIYNSLNKKIRNIYAVISRANDAVSLQFSDGVFGNLPVGTFRTYYRVSNGLSYTINTQDIKSVSISIPYTSSKGQPETLTISLSLSTSVSNAAIAETNETIKANAPATYYTQNRMITGEDYNISPLSVSTEVAKIKAVNRTSSGISRYFDLIDPTGKYSSTQLFADDGVVYKENFTDQVRFSYQTRTDVEAIIYNDVIDILKKKNLRNFYYSNYLTDITPSLDVSWHNVAVDSNSSTGYVGDLVNNSIYKVGTYTSTDLRYFRPGALIKIIAPSGKYFNTLDSNTLVSVVAPGTVSTLWAEIVTVVDDGTASGTGTLSTGLGPIVLNQVVPSGSIITKVIPRWRTTIESSTISIMIDLIYSNKPFGLRYDSDTQVWKIIFEANLNTSDAFNLGKQGDISSQQLDSSWLVLFTTDNEYYTIESREQRYVFESDKQLRFFYEGSDKVYDTKTNKIVKDSINVLSVNTVPNSISAFTIDKKWEIVEEYRGLDGYIDSKKVVVAFADTDDNGVVDNPELFIDIVDPTNLNIPVEKRYIVQEKYVISPGQEDYRYVYNDGIVLIRDSKSSLTLNNSYNGQYFYFIDSDTVQLYQTGTWSVTLDYKVLVGRDNLKFQYIHSADYESRIDAGVSNIIDTYVLTKTYDTNFRRWLAGAISTKPLPPGSDELYDIMAPSLNIIKSISDEVIYHPVSYKILFGATAELDLQASFKIIKNSNQVISDNDIKAKAIVAINQFFALENWDFGDTFYFTELSTYVVNQLAPNISSFVIVPRKGGLSFGSLFEIKSASDQIFINGATVDDIEIISGITPSLIKSAAGTTVESLSTSQQSITSSTYGSNN